MTNHTINERAVRFWLRHFQIDNSPGRCYEASRKLQRHLFQWGCTSTLCQGTVKLHNESNAMSHAWLVIRNHNRDKTQYYLVDVTCQQVGLESDQDISLPDILVQPIDGPVKAPTTFHIKLDETTLVYECEGTTFF